MADEGGAFWDDLARDLEDEEFRRQYLLDSQRIATIDRIVNELDAARAKAGLSKAALARAVNGSEASMRRLFSAPSVNPTLGSLAEIAAALGLKVTLQPLSAEERRTITNPLQRQMTDRGLRAR
jgi:DNA-binding phage protein